MLPLISLTTQFLLIALVVTAVALGATVGLLFVRSRGTQEDERLSNSEHAELKQRDDEIAVIRSRIEEIYKRQQTGSQTQHAVLHQRIEKLQNHLKARARQIEGIQSHLQYEMQQRQREMDELRAQLREAVTTFKDVALPAAGSLALPEAEVPAQMLEDATSLEDAHDEGALPVEELIMVDTQAEAEQQLPSASSGTEEPALTAEEESAEDVPVEASPTDTGGWKAVELTFDLHVSENADDQPGDEASTPRDAESDARPRFQPLSTFLDTVPDVPANREEYQANGPAPSAAPSSSENYENDENDEDEAFGDLIQWTYLAQDEPDPDSQNEAVEESSTKEGALPENAAPAAEGHYMGGDGMPVEEATPAVGKGSGTEDLTLLPMIDARRQKVIISLGVRTIEEIARWSRIDARRVVAEMPEVSEEEVMNEWIFAAQSLLFERYQTELRSRSSRE
jgi:predicted flap endonuclease-1-like 5' DNA nuclease